MTDVALDVAGAVREARALVDAGEFPAALAILRPTLATIPLDPDTPDADVADAARLCAGVLTSLGESYSALPYSTYAHRAATVLAEPTAIQTLQIDLVHAYVLRATVQLTEAVDLYRDVTRRLAQRFGAGGRPTLACQADLAVAVHAAGRCKEASRILHGTYVAHREAFGPADPQGIRILVRLASMNLDCGEFDRAHQYFDGAKALCAQHLTATDPLARQVVAASRAGSDPAHVCGEPARGQPHLTVRDLFVSAADLEVRDLVVSALDVDVQDPVVSAFELLTSGAPVSVSADPALAQDASLWVFGALSHISGHISIDGSGTYPFSIDATVSSRKGLSLVQIQIFAPEDGAGPQ